MKNINVKQLSAKAARYAPAVASGLLALGALALPGSALASSSGGLPWEGPLDTLVDSITGPVAMAVSLIGVIGAAGALIWGGEMNEFLRKMIMIVLVIAVLVGASGLLSTLFGVGGAVITTAALSAA